jgi:hypothetical protein
MDALTGLELAAAGLALWAAIQTLPRPPRRDWERLFKVALATQLWEVAQAEGGDEGAITARWDALLRAQVPFHPAGRAPVAKLFAPSVAGIEAPALDGERALVEALARLADPPARWQRMYVEDLAAADALTSHPEALGPACDPANALGPACGWEAISRWDPAVPAALAARTGHLQLVLCGAPALAAAIRAAAPGLRIADDHALDASLLDLCPAPADRLVLILGHAPMGGLLRALAEAPGLRDRVLVIVGVGAPRSGGPDDDAFFSSGWTHEAMAPELQRTTAIYSVWDVDPDSPAAAWEAQLLPPPRLEPGAAPTLELLPLGPLPLGRVAPAQLARALLTTLAVRLLGPGA